MALLMTQLVSPPASVFETLPWQNLLFVTDLNLSAEQWHFAFKVENRLVVGNALLAPTIEIAKTVYHLTDSVAHAIGTGSW